MTCIVGLVDNGKVYIGADSATTSGSRRIIRKNPKAIKRGEFVIGGAGVSVINNVMAHVTTIPPFYENQDSIDYLMNTFIPLFRTAIKEMGQMTVKDGVETTGNNFLIGFRGHLFRIGTDFSVLEPVDNFESVGSGGHYALGVLYATADSDMKPEERINQALKCASYFDSHVYPPFEIESIETEKGFNVDKIMDKANKMMEED